VSPASAHADRQRRLGLVIEREYVPDPARCVRAILALLAAPATERGGATKPVQADHETARAHQ
jgi:hypothetical protein